LAEDSDPSPSLPSDAALRSAILELLGPSPAQPDDIVRLSGAPARLVQLVLLELELAGRIERQVGGRVSLI
jgi:DNA processing protein